MKLKQLPQAKNRYDYRASNYTITDIELIVNIDSSCTKVTAITQIKRLGSSSAELRLDGKKLTLLSLYINDTIWLKYQLEADTLVLSDLPDFFTLKIVNIIHPDQNTALQGLYKSGKTLCTQCEPEGFRYITWYLDRPDILARFTTTIIAEQSLYPYLLSNGNRVGGGQLKNGYHWIKWYDPFPKPCYLFAIVAGDFDVLLDSFKTRSDRDVALKIFVDPGNLDHADWAMTSLKNSIKWDEERFGLEYDLDIFMIVAIDLFNMGAMENKGLNIFNSKYILANAETATDKDYLDIQATIGHEYFHNWTGNRVTCRDWFQLSLKEGLTVFREQEFSADLGSSAVNRINNVRVMRGLQFAEDASSMAHPIRPEQFIEINNFYTLTIYEKGAEVIRMLFTLLGCKHFQKGIHLYFKRHDGGTATCDDFMQAMEDASNISLSQFRLWYSQSGTPVLSIHDHYNPELEQYTLHVTQMTPPTIDQKEKLPLHIPLDIELYDNEGKVILLQHIGNPIYNVLNVLELSQTFVFDNVYVQPVPSLLRNFSAPVKLDYNWTDNQLIFLIQYARDDFSRWDAAQNLIKKYIKINVVRHQHGQIFSLPSHVIDTLRTVLLEKNSDPALIAMILSPPSENEIAEIFEIIDPQTIAIVRQALVSTLTKVLADELLAVYYANQTIEYRIKNDDIGKRSLKNICLSYLAFGDHVLADKLIKNQFVNANNMTDSMAALSAAVVGQLPCCVDMLATFDERWHQNGLVMDKWFTLQATSPATDVLTQVRRLLNHRSFTLSNPNRVRSLIGAFSQLNPAAFHAIDGSGYQFLVDILTDLNTRNSQIAARMIEPLICLKRYDSIRQQLMYNALEQLKALDNLSCDLFEKILKALST